MGEKEKLLELAERCEKATGPDRELDAEIAEFAYGWKRAKVGPDYDGQNASEILTQDGRLLKGFAYPPRGVIPLCYHVPEYTRDPLDPEVPRCFIRERTAAVLRARAAQSEESNRG